MLSIADESAPSYTQLRQFTNCKNAFEGNTGIFAGIAAHLCAEDARNPLVHN